MKYSDEADEKEIFSWKLLHNHRNIYYHRNSWLCQLLLKAANYLWFIQD